jgi:hypothetical protein
MAHRNSGLVSCKRRWEEDSRRIKLGEQSSEKDLRFGGRLGLSEIWGAGTYSFNRETKTPDLTREDIGIKGNRN